MLVKMGKLLLSVLDGVVHVCPAARRKHRRRNATTSHTCSNSNRPNPVLASCPDPSPLHSNTTVVPITTRRICSLPSTVSWEPRFWNREHLTTGIHPAHIRQDALRYHGPPRHQGSHQECPVREKPDQPRDCRWNLLLRGSHLTPGSWNKDQ